MKQYSVDVFTDQLFAGHPVAVCVDNHAFSDRQMENIAMENGSVPTAFVFFGDEHAFLSGPDWNNPASALASAYVLKQFYLPEQEKIILETPAEPVTVTGNGDWYSMLVPAPTFEEIPDVSIYESFAGKKPTEAYAGKDLLLLYQSEEEVLEAIPKMEPAKLNRFEHVVITAAAPEFDCISRVFAVKETSYEEKTSGAAYGILAAYWCEKKRVKSMTAFMASCRGGLILCGIESNDIKLSGRVVLYAKSEILPEKKEKTDFSKVFQMIKDYEKENAPETDPRLMEEFNMDY